MMTNYLFEINTKKNNIKELPIELLAKRPRNLFNRFKKIHKEETEKLSKRLNTVIDDKLSELIFNKSCEVLEYTINDLNRQKTNQLFGKGPFKINRFKVIDSEKEIITFSSSKYKSVHFKIDEIDEVIKDILFSEFRTMVYYSTLGHLNKEI